MEESDKLLMAFQQTTNKMIQAISRLEERLDKLEKTNKEQIDGIHKELIEYIKFDKNKIIEDYLKDVVEADKRMDEIESKMFKR